jgi:hypothetical protein
MTAFDVAAGTLTTGAGDVLGPGLTRTAFLASAIGHDAESLVVNPPFASWRIRCLLDGRPFRVGLFFDDERLTMLIAALDDPAFGASWADWTRDAELRRKAAHDAWLAIADPGLADGRNQAWGFVASVMDEKSGGAEIVIRYGARLPERPPVAPIRFGPRVES